METSKDCVFCDAPNTWQTDIIITGGGITGRVSICPKCRGTHKIQELYRKIVDNLITKIQSVLKETVEKGAKT